MNIITLTTDMGLEDYYVAALKATILHSLTEIQIVDISHSIRPFGIEQAAYVLKNCMDNFPEETVHVIGVDAEPLINFRNEDDSVLPTIIRYKKQYFIGADNGVFGLLTDGETPEEIWRLDDVLSNPKAMYFPTKNIYVPAACKILQEIKLGDFCSPAQKIRKAMSRSPIIDGHVLRGAVHHIDHYGNIITNISRSDFEKVGKNVPFIIYFRRKEYFIDKISGGYNEVPFGEKVAIFNDGGLLEIAINKGTPENGGGANTLLGLRLGDIISIEFTPRGSRDTIDSLF